MNPSEEKPASEELLDGELSDEELYAIAAGLEVKVGLGKRTLIDLTISNGGS